MKSFRNFVVCIALVVICAGAYLAYQRFSPVSATSPTPSDPTYTQATRGSSFLTDSLTSQDGNKWFEGQQLHGGNCLFTGGKYQASESSTGYYNFCGASIGKLDNFVFQAQMTITRGDAGGLSFRADSVDNAANFYAFTICTNPICTTGSYALYKCLNHSCKDKELAGGASPAINGGNQTNLLIVIARGHDIYLYVNSDLVAHVQDSSLSSGDIGMTAYSVQNVTDAEFSNVQVWKL